MLDFSVVLSFSLALPFFFFLDSLFFYLCCSLRYDGAWQLRYAVYSWYWTYGYCGTTGLRRLYRDVVDQGHRPKERFLCWLFWRSVNFRVPGFTCLSVWCGHLFLHVEKKREDPPLSGFHLDVQCSDQYEGYWRSCTWSGRVSVYVSECIDRQRFPFGDVMGQGPFQVSPFMQYALRPQQCTPSFRFSRADEGQTVSGSAWRFLI